MYEEEIKDGLKSIPGAYMVEDIITKKSKRALKIIIEKLEKEDKTAVYDLAEERTRDYNLLSYLFWSVGDSTNAFKYNEKVTESDKNNITAIANKTWFHFKSQEFYKAQLSWDKILDLKSSHQFDAITLKGEAEIAYYYTRLGFRHYEKAVTSFKVVLNKSLHIPTINQSLVYLWKAGLGLTYRRLSHVGNVGDEEQMKATEQRLKNSVEVLLELIEADWDSPRNKAFAFVQLAIVDQTIRWEGLKKQDYFPETFLEWDAERFYMRAEALCGRDSYTLERFGQYLRYRHRFADAEQKLRSAIEIMPTSTAHHHLALTLKGKLIKEITSKQREAFTRSLSTQSEARYQQRTPFQYDNQTAAGKHVRRLFSDDQQKNIDKCSDQNTLPSKPASIQDSLTSVDSGINSMGISGAFAGAAGKKETNTRPLFSDNQQKNMERSSSQQTVPSKANFKQDTDLADSGIYSIEHSDTSVQSNMGAVGGASVECLKSSDINTERLVTGEAKTALSRELEHVSLEDQGKSTNVPYEKQQTQKMAREFPIGSTKNDRQTETTYLYQRERSSLRDRGKEPKNKIYVKSPKKLFHLPKDTEDTRTKEILLHLDRSLALGENRAAKYDKGLMLRAMEEFDRAIDVFKSLLEEETSLMYLANAYEQCGLCLQSIIDDLCDDSDRKKNLLYNQKCYLMRSVAISTQMVSRIPNISEAWVSGTTLKKIIQGEGKSKKSLKELAILCEKLRSYKDAIGYYQEIINLDETEQRNPDLLMKIARNQIDDKNFVEAVSLFDFIRMIPTGKEFIDQKLYITALIEAGFDTVQMKTEPQLGAEYLKTALNQISFLNENRMYRVDGTEDEDFDFDIFILCDKTDETMLGKAARLMNILENTCNLKVTLNEKDIVGGVLELSAMLSVINQSKNIIIYFDRSCKQNVTLMRCIEHAVRNKSNIVTVIPDENIRISDNLKMFPWLVHKSFFDDDKENVEWMKKLFYKFSECWLKYNN